jgi:AraC-like DNA-binding protein
MRSPGAITIIDRAVASGRAKLARMKEAVVLGSRESSVRSIVRLAVPPHPEPISAAPIRAGHDLIRCQRYTEPTVNGTLDFARLLWLGIGRVRADAHRVLHPPKSEGPVGREQHIVLQVSGSSLLEQSGRTWELPAGYWTVLGSQPYAIVTAAPSERVVLLVGQKHFAQSLSRAHAEGGIYSTARGWGRFLLLFVTHLLDELPHLPTAHAGGLAEHFTLTLQQALRQQLCPDFGPQADVPREQILQYVSRHLRDPELTVARIAAALHWSRRKVNRAFASGGETLLEYIRRRRLEGVCQDLLDPALRRQSLSQIALSWGFRDYPPFCRHFRAHFGMSPQAMRRRAQP